MVKKLFTIWVRRSVNKGEVGRRRRNGFDVGKTWRPGATTSQRLARATLYCCRPLGFAPSTQEKVYPMKHPYALFISIDRSDKHLDFRVLDGSGNAIERGKVSTDPSCRLRIATLAPAFLLPSPAKKTPQQVKGFCCLGSFGVSRPAQCKSMEAAK